MKKTILSLVAVLMGAAATYAQSSLLATLTHNGETTVYYGTTALSQAHEAADNGDVITLSSGTFTAVDITKAITLRGAGMAEDPTTKSEPTVLKGGFYISIEDGGAETLTLEGLYCSEYVQLGKKLTGATFQKCRFYTVSCANNVIAENLTMIHCKIARSITASSGSSISLLNCIVWEPGTNSSVWQFTNCIVSKNAIYSSLSNSSFKNCVFVGNGQYNYHFSNSNTMYKCLMAWDENNCEAFNDISNATNQVAPYATIFKTCTDGTYSDSETFELTAAAAQTYTDTDGTQVGIYGGSLPFDMRPSNPQITNAEVASKSDANGLLHINITVQGAE